MQPFDIDNVGKAFFGLLAPLSVIDERLRLHPVLAALVSVNLEAIALRNERRVNLAQVDALLLNLAPQ